MRHSKKAKIAIMSNARPPNVPPTIRPIGTLDWVMALGVVDESAPDTVVEAVRDDGLDDMTDVDVAPAGMTRK